MRTAFLARRASTSKSRLKKGSSGCSQARQDPPSPYNSPHEPCNPWPGSAGRDTTSIMRQGQAARCPHHSLNTEWGVESERACGRAHLITASPAHPSPARPPGTPFTSISALPQYRSEGWRRIPGLMRVDSTSEKLLRWKKENQVEKNLPITRNKEGLVGCRWRGAGKKGPLSLGAKKGPICGLWTPRCPARLGAGSGQGQVFQRWGEKLVSV